jgi:hypothetical protein
LNYLLNYSQPIHETGTELKNVGVENSEKGNGAVLKWWLSPSGIYEQMAKSLILRTTVPIDSLSHLEKLPEDLEAVTKKFIALGTVHKKFNTNFGKKVRN